MAEHEEIDQALADEAEESVAGSVEAADGLTLEEQLEAEKDRSLRLQAELQNVLARSSREVASERQYGAIGLMRDLLPVLDNVDRALEAADKEESDGDSGLLEGFRLVRQQLLSVLEQHGCKPIETEGADFDPTFHEAILHQPSEEHPAGAVAMTTQTGYQLHDRVVRPAQVIVSSGAPGSE